MCFGPESTPPAAPRAGLLAGSERLTLTSSDGARPVATFARTTATDAPGVVILPDVRGLQPYYEQLAAACAGAGVHAIAVDYYTRSAGSEYRDNTFDHTSHRALAEDAHLTADARAAFAELRRAGVTRCYVLGFCFGGRGALLQATDDDWAGIVGFYPWPTRVSEQGRSPLTDAQAGAVRAPVLAMYGGADEMIPAADRDAYAQALKAAQVPHQTLVWDGAPHSFFDRHAVAHAEACREAWLELLRFVV